MSWIKELNKRLEEQRQALRDAQESGEALSRIKSHAGKISATTEAGKKQRQDRADKAKEWRKENPDKVSKNASKAGKIGGPKGGKNQPLEVKQANAKKMNDSMDYKKRLKTGSTKSKNDTKKRNKRMQQIYDTIQETDWFNADEIRLKYQFKGTRKHTKNQVVTEQMMKILLRKSDLFESKIEYYNYINEKGKHVNSKQVLFKKK